MEYQKCKLLKTNPTDQRDLGTLTQDTKWKWEGQATKAERRLRTEQVWDCM